MTLRLPRLRVLVLGAALVTSLGWVVSNGLTSNLVYYETPSDLLAKGAAAAGERVRLGGLVEAGAVRDSAGGVSFVVTDGAPGMTGGQHGGGPAMFQARRG